LHPIEVALEGFLAFKSYLFGMGFTAKTDRIVSEGCFYPKSYQCGR